jgi:hypothetical protein
MKTSIFKSILAGLLLGVLFFVAFRFVLIVLLIAAIFRLSGMGRWKREHWNNRRMAFAESVRNMNEDEYEQFRSKGHHHGYCHHC